MNWRIDITNIECRKTLLEFNEKNSSALDKEYELKAKLDIINGIFQDELLDDNAKLGKISSIDFTPEEVAILKQLEPNISKIMIPKKSLIKSIFSKGLLFAVHLPQEIIKPSALKLIFLLLLAVFLAVGYQHYVEYLTPLLELLPENIEAIIIIAIIGFMFGDLVSKKVYPEQKTTTLKNLLVVSIVASLFSILLLTNLSSIIFEIALPSQLSVILPIISVLGMALVAASKCKQLDHKISSFCSVILIVAIPSYFSLGEGFDLLKSAMLYTGFVCLSLLFISIFNIWQSRIESEKKEEYDAAQNLRVKNVDPHAEDSDHINEDNTEYETRCPDETSEELSEEEREGEGFTK